MRPDAHSLLAAYAADAVDADERADVEAHLIDCVTCSDDLVELRQTLAELAGQVEEAPRPALRAAVLAAAAATAQVRPPSHRRAATSTKRRSGGDGAVVLPMQRRQPPLRTRAPLAVAAGFAVLTALGVATSGLLWRQLADTRNEQSAVAEVFASADGEVLRSQVTLPPGVEPSAGADTDELVVVVSPTSGSVLLTAGLPEAPEGSTYQMWYISDAGVRSAGLVERDDEVVLFDGAVADASAVAVSLEPSGGSAAPTTDPVAVLPLTT